VDVLLKFYPRKAFVFVLYLRQKPIFEILGLLFDISKTKANDTFNYWLDILRDILPASQMEEVRENREQYEKLRNLLTEYQLIDSTEQPTARPVDYGSRRNTTRARCTL